jgi:hypothetical protein
MKKIILIQIVTLIFACSCNKTKQTLNKIYGNYIVNSYTVNDEDSLSLFKDSLPDNFEFHYNDDNQCIWNIMGYNAAGEYIYMSIQWTLEDYKTLIIRGISTTNIGTGPFGFNKKPIWEITKLKRSEFNMKTTFNNKEYAIEMEKN